MENKKTIITILITFFVFFQIIGIVYTQSEHQACSNRERERQGLQEEPPEREPPEKGPTSSTTTTLPLLVRQSTTTIACTSDQDCAGGYVCCMRFCRNLSTGMCKDINGDGMSDWVPYISPVMGSILNGFFRFFLWF
jgi:hypothetical protein